MKQILIIMAVIAAVYLFMRSKSTATKPSQTTLPSPVPFVNHQGIPMGDVNLYTPQDPGTIGANPHNLPI